MAERRRKRYAGPPAPPAPTVGRVTGRISIVQESRFRLVDATGRGYLFIAHRRAASLDELERWRDEGTVVAVDYDGVPDIGAVARSVRVVGR